MTFHSSLPDEDHDDDVDDVCTSSTLGVDDVDNLVSRLSIESFDAPAARLGTCRSLPSTPPRRMGRVRSNRWGFEFEGGAEKTKKSKRKEVDGFSGESGVMLITRPKGGNRELCMDLEEVKACRDLGFELEHQRMLDIPSRLSFSNSTLDTTSISSPGDDPRDVKARLKVWAQAVALVSASKYGT